MNLKKMVKQQISTILKMFLEWLVVCCPVFFLLSIIVYKVFKLPKQDLGRVKKLLFPNNTPVIIAHRAGKDQAPENTLLAIETAYKNGATAIEVDLCFTKDKVPVLLHDDTLDRTTNGTGLICKTSYKDVLQLNAAAKFGRSVKNVVKVPTLSEAVQFCVEKNIIIDLDVKSNSMETVETLKFLQKTVPGVTDIIFVTSFHAHILYAVRRHCPDFLIGIIWDPTYIVYTFTGDENYKGWFAPLYWCLDIIYGFLVHSFIPDFLGVSLVSIEKDMLSKNYVEKWRAKGIEVAAWTVNKLIEKNFLLHLGVPIITDSIEKFQ
ncbi:glycerophosphodiester phosphodiesterase 1 isoform X2 [Hydra vulgaris]|uniref:Glycerophosphodiester phosphodiesterase 1 isoform X2 n=2 Tax=Hydra vulgaris TaxID=6087 RepID=A0ABM4D914_HYDVU